MTLRPIEELLYPPAIKPQDVYAVGTLDGKPWHADKHFAVAGPAPTGAQPAKPGQDFGRWLAGEWRTATPEGWNYIGEGDDGQPVVQFAPEWADGRMDGYASNFVNGRYFRSAIRLGVAQWERNENGTLLLGRTANGDPVAIVACMRFLKGKA